jgi:hypothetical protein
MGTNFYTLSGKHIGKRSAAGLWCWDCGVTLCVDGPDNVHRGCGHKDPFCSCNWYSKCPKCGKAPNKETLDDNSAGRELGFNKSKPKKKTGVASCSSFGWAIAPDILLKSKTKTKTIKDEYGSKMTMKEFKDMLKECPIQNTDCVGMDFS